MMSSGFTIDPLSSILMSTGSCVASMVSMIYLNPSNESQKYPQSVRYASHRACPSKWSTECLVPGNFNSIPPNIYPKRNIKSGMSFIKPSDSFFPALTAPCSVKFPPQGSAHCRVFLGEPNHAIRL